MADTMGNAERTVRMVYGSGATIYFCLPEVTLAGAVSFGVAAMALLIAILTGFPGARTYVASAAPAVVDEFTA